MKIVVATQNPGKFSELIEVVGDLNIEFLSLQEFNIKAEPEENGETYEDNALIKAIYYHQLTGLPVIGEDSGIFVEALAGELGVQTRRWGKGALATDEEWIDHFLLTMGNYPENRNAKFVSVACFYDGVNSPQFFRGETLGMITQSLEAPIVKGIPISSCFRPEGSDKVYAAMTASEKNMISHRGKAAQKLYNYLANY